MIPLKEDKAINPEQRPGCWIKGLSSHILRRKFNGHNINKPKHAPGQSKFHPRARLLTTRHTFVPPRPFNKKREAPSQAPPLITNLYLFLNFILPFTVNLNHVELCLVLSSVAISEFILNLCRVTVFSNFFTYQSVRLNATMLCD